MPTKVKKPKKGGRPVPADLQGLKNLLRVVSRGKYLWESTFDAIRDPVMIIDRSYTIERANLEAASRSGREIRDLIGQKCYRVFAQREGVCPGCPMKEVLSTQKPRSVEIEKLMPERDFLVDSYPMATDEETGRNRVVHHYREVTEEKRLQRKLIQTEKMAAVGMLASGVAHEINNPLAGILAFTQLLQKDLAGQAPVQEDLREIENAARRCKKIVEDLLTFARPHGEGKKSPLSIPEEVEKILPLARLNLRHYNVTMATEYAPDLPLVQGSSVRLQQVFLNLINNAAQAMREKGGEVRLRVRTVGDQVVAEVIDHGIGISHEDLPRVFDPFFTTKGAGEGTGLGLSICYSIISEHGGKIEVESREGRGSLFRVLLPVSVT